MKFNFTVYENYVKCYCYRLIQEMYVKKFAVVIHLFCDIRRVFRVDEAVICMTKFLKKS